MVISRRTRVSTHLRPSSFRCKTWPFLKARIIILILRIAPTQRWPLIRASTSLIGILGISHREAYHTERRSCPQLRLQSSIWLQATLQATSQRPFQTQITRRWRCCSPKRSTHRPASTRLTFHRARTSASGHRRDWRVAVQSSSTR